MGNARTNAVTLEATLYYKFSWCCLYACMCAGNKNAMNFKCISNAVGYIDGVYRISRRHREKRVMQFDLLSLVKEEREETE